MSFSIDVNLLLYASTTGSPFHERASEFVTDVAPNPCALENVESILRLPHVRMLREEEGFWDLYREVTRGIAVRGKLVPDAHLATILRQHGVTTLFTNDRDFRLFDFLDVRNPLA